jgi:hypothetical protein
MTKESQQKNSGAQGNDENNRWGKVKTFFRENPTFVLTLMYVDLTGIGLLYSWLFYRHFGINTFDFAEIGDFLLAAFKVPAVTFSALLAQVLFVALPFIIVRVSLPSGPSGLLAPLFLGAAFVVFLLTLVIPLRFAYSQAEAIKAEAIKQGKQTQATVRYRTFSSPSTGQVTKSGVALIGATQKVVFFYDVDENYARRTTIVIPQAQIVWIEVPDRGAVDLFE